MAVRALLEPAETTGFGQARSVMRQGLDDEVTNGQLAARTNGMNSAAITSSSFRREGPGQGPSAHLHNVHAVLPEQSVQLTLISVGKGARTEFGENCRTLEAPAMSLVIPYPCVRGNREHPCGEFVSGPIA